MDPHRPPHPPHTVPDDVQNDFQPNTQLNSNATSTVELSFVIEPSADSQAQSQELNDVLMDDPGYDSMPGLASDGDSDSASEAHEVEMQAVDADDDDDDGIPQLIEDDVHEALRAFMRPSSLQMPSFSVNTSSGASNANHRPNRRARVEDDEDEERDRRHPSLRMSSAPSATSSFNSTPSASTPNQSAAPTPTPPPQPQGPWHIHHRHPHIHRQVFHAAIGIPRRPGDAPLLRIYQPVNPGDNSNGSNATPADPGSATSSVSDRDNDIDNNDNAAPQVLPPLQPQLHELPPTVEGVAVSFEVGPDQAFDGPLPAGPGNQPQGIPNANANAGDAQPQTTQQPNAPRPPLNPNNPLANLIGNLFGGIGVNFEGNPVNINFNWGDFAPLGFGSEKEDPERAKKLVDGLEEVPVGLVRRLERVGGTGGGMGQDANSGGDAGCAICWDKLLDSEGEGFGKDADADAPPSTEDVAMSEEDKKDHDEGSSSASKDNEARKYPKIVSLPCAHVFHADCLIPWFSRPRHTTCPTCRFNIDPDNLTYVSAARRRREQEQRAREEAQQNGDDAPLSQPSQAAEGAGAGVDNNTDNNNESATNPVAGLLGRWREEMIQATAEGEGAPPPTTGGTVAGPGAAPRGVPPGVQSTTIQTPQGTVNIIQVPIPIVIPVQVPVGPGALGALGPSGMANVVGAPPTPAAAPAPALGGDVPALPQAQMQPQPQPSQTQATPPPPPPPVQPQGQGQGGEFARFLSHLFQHALGAAAGANVTVVGPVNSLPPVNHDGWHRIGPIRGTAPGPSGQGQSQSQVQPLAGSQGVSVGVGVDAASQQGPAGNPTPPTFLPGFPFHAHGQPTTASAPAADNGGSNSQNAPPTTTTQDAPSLVGQQPPGLPPPVNPFTPRGDMMRYTIDMVFNGPMPGAGAGWGILGPFPEPLPGFVNATVGNSGAAGAQQPQASAANAGGGLPRTRASSLPPDATFVERQGVPDPARMRDLVDIFDMSDDEDEDEQEEQEAVDRAVAAILGGDTGRPAGGQPQQGQQQPQQQQRGPQGQSPPPHVHTFPGVGFGGPGVHVASGSGRTMQEAFAQVFAGFRQSQAGQPQPQVQPQAGGQQQQQGAPGGVPAAPQQPQSPPPAPGVPPFPPHGFRIINAFSDLFGSGPRERENRPKRTWTLPPAPGPTLRQRIERKEREAGLRCFDISCGIGPSDEEPNAAEGGKQVSIKSVKDHQAFVCGHTFHSACLVSAERVALSAKGAEDIVETEDGQVEVSCPVCRGVGCVSREEWNEGVLALA